MAIATKNVQGRRELHFQSLEDIVADAERLVASPTTKTLGNWPLGQLISQYKLDVALHVPIHGQPGSQEQFARILNGAVVPDSHGPLILPASTSGTGDPKP